jgi:fructose-1,6-bisphosphatase-3
LVIDGGLSKAYQKVTGNAGYTLIYNSYGLLLATHKPFDSRKKAIMEEKDIYTTLSILEKQPVRKRVGDTDIGKSLRQQIQDLEMLLEAYREGIIKENLL